MNYYYNTHDINKNLQGTNYKLARISWNDVSRYNGPNGLSAVGNNITDCKLVGRDNESFYTIRTDNWNEKIGTVSANDIAIISESNGTLKPMTLKQYLVDAGLYSSSLDDKVSIRFQTSFLPVKDNKTVEFCTESYSYNTQDESNPKNLLLLCTTQGTTLHKNKSRYQKLFLHGLDSNNNLVNRWLEAEETTYKVGSEQRETDEQVSENMKRNKASSSVIGIKAMGKRFNALMTVQIPLKQKEQKDSRWNGLFTDGPIYSMSANSYGNSSYSGSDLFGGFKLECTTPEWSTDSNVLANQSFLSACKSSNSCCDECSDSDENLDSFCVKLSTTKSLTRSRGGNNITKSSGSTSAARVSKGSIADEKAIKIDPKDYARSESEHITVTVILYHTIRGSSRFLGDDVVPSKEDTLAAVSELDQLYDSCMWSGNLKDLSKHNVIPDYKTKYPNQFVPNSTPTVFFNRTTFPV
jgi:huntingtin